MFIDINDNVNNVTPGRSLSAWLLPNRSEQSRIAERSKHILPQQRQDIKHPLLAIAESNHERMGHQRQIRKLFSVGP